MATEVEYVNYKEFVAGLETTENPGVDDVTVVSNETDGPRTIPANTSALSNTATDSDLTAAASVDLQTASGKKKAPANLFAKQSGLETTNGNVTALTTYSQNVAHSIAPEFDPDKVGGYLENEVVVKDGKLYKFTSDHTGAWSNTDVVELNVTEAMNFVFKLLFDNSEKTIAASDDGFYYFKIPFVKGMTYSIETVGESTYATLINAKTQSATGQVLYQATYENKDFVADSDYLYLRVYITSGSTVKVRVKSLEDYVNAYTAKLKAIVCKDTLTLTTSYHKNALAPIEYEKGVVYNFVNTGTNAVAVFLMKSKSTQAGEIAVRIGDISAGESKTYKVGDDEFSWINIYGDGLQTGTHEVKVEQLVSNVALYESVQDALSKVDELGAIVNKDCFTFEGAYNSTRQHPIFYKKGLIYKFINTGTSPIALYLMKSKSTQASEIAVTLTTSLAAGSYITYNVDDVEFSWLNSYGLAGGEGTYEVKVEQLTSNFALQEKIEELQETVAGLVSNTIPSFSIIGDSYSTYQGFLADSNAESYYHDGGGPVPLENGVKDTWWFKLANRMKSILFANNSWSGSTISNTVRPGLPDSSSMVYRVDNAFGSDQIGSQKPNMIIFFGGTNDSWLENPMGEPQYSGWTSSDLLETLPALCYCFDKLLTYNPGVRIVFVLNTGLSATFNEGVETICEHYGIDLVVLNNIDKSSSHPTSTGMQQICDQIYAAL